MKLDRKSKYERFRLLVIDARMKSGLSQENVADRLNRPQSYVSKCERGERRMDVIEFIEIAHAIGFDPAAFIRELDLVESKQQR